MGIGKGGHLMLTSSMTRTLPTVVSRMALVFFSDSPSALPTKSAGFFTTTGTTVSETKLRLEVEKVLVTFSIADKTKIRQNLAIKLRDSGLSGTRVPQENTI